MLESLNYSFRNPKNIIWVIYHIKQLRNYKKNHGVLRGPQLDKQRWRARLGILRVNIFKSLFYSTLHVLECKDSLQPNLPHTTYRARWMDFALRKIVNERHVVTRMPIQWVEDCVKCHCLKQSVYWLNNLKWNTKPFNLLPTKNKDFFLSGIMYCKRKYFSRLR